MGNALTGEEVPQENEQKSHESDLKSDESTTSDKPLRVVVSGAAGQICYSILFAIGRGELLGPDQKIDLVCLDIEPAMKSLNGVMMEINDCAFALINKLVGTCSYEEAFTDADICILIGAFPRKKGMLRADLLKRNAGIFKGQGEAMDKFAKKTCKTLVVGNPANTNALICSTYAASIPKENFTAMTRLDHNRACSQIAQKLGCRVEQVENVTIWGNHSKTQYPDVNNAVVRDFPNAGFDTPVRTAVKNDEWCNEEFVKSVQQRGSAIIAARGFSSAASAANAALSHVRDWVMGTAPGTWVSMGVMSDGSYGVPEGIIYSFPCTCANGEYKIVQGLNIDSFSQKLMTETANELIEEAIEAGVRSE